ncbi:transglycosylase SLT domain-containing protein [Bacteroidota bacterium]
MKDKKFYLFIAIILTLLMGYFFSVKNTESEKLPQEIESIKDTNGIILKEIPTDLAFAGERVPIEDIDIRERYDREIIINTHFHSNTILLLKKANRWMPIISEVVRGNNLPDDFAFLPFIEGGLTNDKSPKGAVGFWQLLAGTARELGLEVNNEVDERYDPVKSTEVASKYLINAKEKFGTWTNAAASFNVGMRGFSRSIESQHTYNYYDLLLNEETSRYIFRILAIKEIYHHPEEYGFSISEDQLYQEEPVEIVKVEETIPDLANYALENGINYKILKRHNPWLRKNSLTIKSSNKFYYLKVPVHKIVAAGSQNQYDSSYMEQN